MQNPGDSHGWESACTNLQGLVGTHDWLEVYCTVVEQVVGSRYAAAEDMGADRGSAVAEGIEGVVAVVQGRCFAVGLDNIHWLWEEDSHSAVAVPETVFV